MNKYYLWCHGCEVVGQGEEFNTMTLFLNVLSAFGIETYAPWLCESLFFFFDKMLMLWEWSKTTYIYIYMIAPVKHCCHVLLSDPMDGSKPPCAHGRRQSESVKSEDLCENQPPIVGRIDGQHKTSIFRKVLNILSYSFSFFAQVHEDLHGGDQMIVTML